MLRSLTRSRSASPKAKRKQRNAAANVTKTSNNAPLRRDSHATQPSVTAALATVTNTPAQTAQVLTDCKALYLGYKLCDEGTAAERTVSMDLSSNRSDSSSYEPGPGTPAAAQVPSSKPVDLSSLSHLSPAQLNMRVLASAVANMRTRPNDLEPCTIVATTQGLLVRSHRDVVQAYLPCRDIVHIARVVPMLHLTTPHAIKQLSQMQQGNGLASLLRRSLGSGKGGLRKGAAERTFTSLAILVKNRDTRHKRKYQCHVVGMANEAATTRIQSALVHSLSQLKEGPAPVARKLSARPRPASPKLAVVQEPSPLEAVMLASSSNRRDSHLGSRSVPSSPHAQRRVSRQVSASQTERAPAPAPQPRRSLSQPSRNARPLSHQTSTSAHQPLQAPLARHRSYRPTGSNLPGASHARQLPPPGRSGFQAVLPANDDVDNFDELDEVLFAAPIERRMSRSAPTSPVPQRRRRSELVSPVHSNRKLSTTPVEQQYGQLFRATTPETSRPTSPYGFGSISPFAGAAMRRSPDLRGRW